MSISLREEEVCAHVMRGLTNPEIGEELGVSRHTVGTHLARVFGKLGIRSRGKLMRFIMQHYLVRGDRVVKKPNARVPAFSELNMIYVQKMKSTS